MKKHITIPSPQSYLCDVRVWYESDLKNGEDLDPHEDSVVKVRVSIVHHQEEHHGYVYGARQKQLEWVTCSTNYWTLTINL